MHPLEFWKHHQFRGWIRGHLPSTDSHVEYMSQPGMIAVDSSWRPLLSQQLLPCLCNPLRSNGVQPLILEPRLPPSPKELFVFIRFFWFELFPNTDQSLWPRLHSHRVNTARGRTVLLFAPTLLSRKTHVWSFCLLTRDQARLLLGRIIQLLEWGK